MLYMFERLIQFSKLYYIENSLYRNLQIQRYKRQLCDYYDDNFFVCLICKRGKITNNLSTMK